MARILEELRGLTADELKARLNDAEEEYANLKFQHGSGQLESPIKVRLARRNVARIKTLLSEHSRAAAAQVEKA